MLSPLYIAEIAPSKIRGRLVSFNQLSIVLGMLFWSTSSTTGSPSRAMRSPGSTSTGWRLMLLSEAVPAVLFLILLTFVPDTPRWYVMKGRMDEARSLLVSLVGEAEARTTLVEIQGSLAVAEQPAGVSLLAFGPLVIVAGILLSAFQQFVGINAVLYYAPLMFKNLGASTDSALLQTVIVGAANVIFTVVAILTVDRLGRKPLLIIGGLRHGRGHDHARGSNSSRTRRALGRCWPRSLHRGFRAVMGPGLLGSVVGRCFPTPSRTARCRLPWRHSGSRICSYRGPSRSSLAIRH